MTGDGYEFNLSGAETTGLRTTDTACKNRESSNSAIEFLSLSSDRCHMFQSQRRQLLKRLFCLTFVQLNGQWMNSRETYSPKMYTRTKTDLDHTSEHSGLNGHSLGDFL